MQLAKLSYKWVRVRAHTHVVRALARTNQRAGARESKRAHVHPGEWTVAIVQGLAQFEVSSVLACSHGQDGHGGNLRTCDAIPATTPAYQPLCADRVAATKHASAGAHRD